MTPLHYSLITIVCVAIIATLIIRRIRILNKRQNDSRA